MTLLLDLQIATAQSSKLPSLSDFQYWLESVLQQQAVEQAEMTVRIVDQEESQSLNNQYRHKNAPTNVLSFPFELPENFPIETSLLGDIIICKEVVESEAQQQNKLLLAHWAHLTIHGCLHLLGFDHIEELAAQKMESLESSLMLKLGYADPYQSEYSL